MILFGLNEECPDLVAHTEGVYCGLLSEVLCTRNSNSKPSHDIEFQDINELVFGSCITELQLHEDNDKEVVFYSLEIKDELPFDHDEGSFSDIHHTHKFSFSFGYIQEHISSCVVIEDVKHEQMAPVHFENEGVAAEIIIHVLEDPFIDMWETSEKMEYVLVKNAGIKLFFQFELSFAKFFFLSRGVGSKLQDRKSVV